MVQVVENAKSATLYERGYSRMVRLVQDTVVRRRVNREFGGSRREPDTRLADSLADLGLDASRMWWGPMTLFPWKAQALIDAVETQRPKSVIEVGSGTSTALFGALAHKYGFEFLSLENHPGTVEYVEHIVEGTPFANKINIQVCDFVKRRTITGGAYYWYDVRLEESDKFDFVFVDGPMGRLVGRNGAIPALYPHLTADFRLYLDDAQREHEAACVRQWQELYPELVHEPVNGDPGLGLIFRGE